MKTLTDLKRDASAGKLKAEMIIRNGDINIPERLKGKRQIISSNSAGITFLNNDGEKSELRIKCASLAEYTGEALTIYCAGYRPLNTSERAIMDGWESIASTKESQRQSEIDMLSDGNQMYYKRKHYFTDKGYEYLLGFDEHKGLKYDFNTKTIRDNGIKGKIDIQYKIYNEGE